VNTPDEHKFLQSIEKNHPVLVPTAKNWSESGKLLGKIRSDTGYSRDRLRDLHFDLLIALTCRSHGAKLISSNRTDFELITSYIPIQLEIWT
jgi:predicted nucleic acid-binding protein